MWEWPWLLQAGAFRQAGQSLALAALSPWSSRIALSGSICGLGEGAGAAWPFGIILSQHACARTQLCIVYVTAGISRLGKEGRNAGTPPTTIPL